jgi:hypothetical protein
MRTGRLRKNGRSAWLVLALAMTGALAGAPAWGAPESPRLDQIRQELSEIDWEEELGFEPWRSPEDLAQDREFWRMFHRKVQELAQCVALKEGIALPERTEVPSAGELEAGAAADLFSGLGFNPWVTPEELLRDRAFLSNAPLRIHALAFRCGRAPDLAQQSSYFNCLLGCTWQYGLCYQGCAAPGPPAPACLDRCEWHLDLCQLICAIQIL